MYETTIPPGAYLTRIVKPGERLRLVDIDGRRGCSLLAYNADQLSERYNAPDTVKVQNQIFLTAGCVLLSDMGRVLFSIVDDTHGCHDTLAGFSDAASVEQQYGAGRYVKLRNSYFRNARDNFVMALGRHGLGRRDLVMSFNPFARIEVEADGALVWRDTGDAAGAAIELRAEMRVLVALTATPHVLDPAGTYAPGPIGVHVSGPSPVDPDDPCRTSCEEARRAFANTDDYLAQVRA